MFFKSFFLWNLNLVTDQKNQRSKLMRKSVAYFTRFTS